VADIMPWLKPPAAAACFAGLKPGASTAVYGVTGVGAVLGVLR